jgi:hypothetical protein
MRRENCFLSLTFVHQQLKGESSTWSDETHHDLLVSLTGADKSGTRALVYSTSPNLQRGYKKMVKPGWHVTGVYVMNSAGEALSPMYNFDLGTRIQRNYQVKLSWLVEEIPVIHGNFGCPNRGGASGGGERAGFDLFGKMDRSAMDNSLLNDYIEHVVLPFYPNINKTAMFDPNTGKLRLVAHAWTML